MEEFRKKLIEYLDTPERRNTRHRIFDHEITLPDHFFPFFDRLLDGYDQPKVLTLGFGSPEFSIYAEKNISGSTIDFIPPTEIIKDFFIDLSCERVRLINETPAPKSKYDIIFANYPFGEKDRQRKKNKAVEVRELSARLSENGVGIFIVEPSFFFLNHDIHEDFHNSDLNIDAAFHLPPGVFKPVTGIAAYLIVVSKNCSDSLFIAELKDEIDSYDTIISNFRQHRNGKILQLGQFVSPVEFTSYPKYIAKQEAEREGARLGYQRRKLSDVAQVKILYKDREILEQNNSVFLPHTGYLSATLSPDESEKKVRYYIQLIFDEDEISDEFMCKLLNSEFGRTLRSSYQEELVLPRISKKSLKDADIYYPNMDTQRRLVHLDNEIIKMQGMLRSHSESIWNEPGDISRTEEVLEKLIEFDNIDYWIETLPFPLASILFKYRATPHPKEKFEYLKHFFEALAQFQVVLLLSGLCSKGECYREIIDVVISKNKGSMSRADFGFWMFLFKHLSEQVKKQLKKEEESEYVRSLFGNPPDRFMKMLTDSKFISIFMDTGKIRNTWHGHPGAISTAKYAELTNTLENYLSKVREIIGNQYKHSFLLLPGRGEGEDGIFTFDAQLLAGPKYPFRTIEFQTDSFMEKKKIYLVHEDRYTPLELLPFIYMRESPETSEEEACYFFNRREGPGKIRFVTYHYEKTPEDYPESEKLLEKLDQYIGMFSP